MKSKYYYYLYFFSLLVVFSCNNPKKKIESPVPFFKVSLAQWSFNRMIINNGENPLDFPKEAKAIDRYSSLVLDVNKTMYKYFSAK